MIAFAGGELLLLLLLLAELFDALDDDFRGVLLLLFGVMDGDVPGVASDFDRNPP